VGKRVRTAKHAYLFSFEQTSHAVVRLNHRSKACQIDGLKLEQCLFKNREAVFISDVGGRGELGGCGQSDAVE